MAPRQPPHFRTVPSLLELSGARERAAEGLGRHFSAQYGVPFRIVDDPEAEAEFRRRVNEAPAISHAAGRHNDWSHPECKACQQREAVTPGWGGDCGNE